MQFLGCLLMLFFIAAAMLLLPVLRIGQLLFGLGRRGGNASGGGPERQAEADAAPRGGGEAGKQGGKIFQADEGEYVDFEEVKD
ncbi:MAG: DUF4834 family protein [Alloprevotella sp.]|nr:DUF4834 family protein [Alloprevotella sp.]